MQPLSNLSLTNVSHFRSPHGVNPNPREIEAQTICVELVTGGRGGLWEAGAWVAVKPGDLLWHMPGEATIGRSDFDDPYRCLAVEFQFEGNFERSTPRITHWSDIDEVRRFSERVVSLAYEDSFDAGILGEYLFAELQFRARYDAWAMQHKRPSASLQRVTELIEERYAEPLGIEELAEASGWSVPHLHVRYREEFGETPHQALIARRVRAAKVRLASTDDPIKQIAKECGFSHATALCTTFKRLTGNTPANFRLERKVGSSRSGGFAL